MEAVEWNPIQAEAWSAYVWQHLHFAEMNAMNLAVSVDVSPDTVHRWLSGEERPSAEQCRAIARALRVSAARVLELAGHDGPVPSI